MAKTIEYLSLSALAYIDFKESDAGLTLDEIIRDEQEKKSRKDFNLDSPELSALQDPSNLPHQNNRLHQLRFYLEGFASLFPVNDYCHIILYRAFFITVIS